MGSLFTKIFLSFWLAALLLGAALFAAERYLGEDTLTQVTGRVDAHAETVSTLLADQGMPAVRRWLAGIAYGERMGLVLLDAQRRPLGDHRPMHPRFRRHLDAPLEPGVHTLRPGLVSVVRPVPGSDPPLYLAALVPTRDFPQLPLGVRIAMAVAVSGLVCFGLAALITRPLRRLRGAAQAVAAGNLDVRVGYAGRDEIAALARDFDLMAERVRELLEAQRRLLRDVSHELRSPLARLRVALELARKQAAGAPMLERIEREADQLEALVADVLSLARLEGGQARFERRPVDLAELLGAVVEDAAFEAEAQDKEVAFAAADGATVNGDPVLLRSAVENVVRNAVRHTPAGTAVEVALTIADAQAVVTVRDRGPGVPEAELARLFEPFARVGEARDRASGGYGLGLAISRQAVQAHGGSIEAANAEGGGLRVTLRLPLAANT